MARRIYLHIGTMKSATTYLQSFMDANPAALRKAGLLRPSLVAMTDLLFGPAKDAPSRWPAFVDRLAAHEGDVIVSNELLSLRQRDKVERLIEALSPTEPHVIVTARDLARVTVSQWQERIRHRPTESWPQFVSQLVKEGSEDDPEMAWFWRRQHLPRIIDVWSSAVGGPSNVTVVTVPPPGSDRDLIRKRFCSVIGLDDAGLKAPANANTAIGAQSIAFMRRLQDGLDQDTRESVSVALKHVVGRQVLAARAASEPPLGLSEEHLTWLNHRAQAFVDEIDGLGVNVVGDLGELVPATRVNPAAVTDTDSFSDGEVLDVALDTIVGLAKALVELASVQNPDNPVNPIKSLGTGTRKATSS